MTGEKPKEVRPYERPFWEDHPSEQETKQAAGLLPEAPNQVPKRLTS